MQSITTIRIEHLCYLFPWQAIAMPTSLISFAAILIPKFKAIRIGLIKRSEKLLRELVLPYKDSILTTPHLPSRVQTLYFSNCNPKQLRPPNIIKNQGLLLKI